MLWKRSLSLGITVTISGRAVQFMGLSYCTCQYRALTHSAVFLIQFCAKYLVLKFLPCYLGSVKNVNISDQEQTKEHVFRNLMDTRNLVIRNIRPFIYFFNYVNYQTDLCSKSLSMKLSSDFKCPMLL